MASVVLKPNIPAYAESSNLERTVRTAGSAYAPGALTGLAAPIPAASTLMGSNIRVDGFNSFMLIGLAFTSGAGPTGQVYVLDPDDESQLMPPNFVDSFVFTPNVSGIWVFGGGTVSSGDKDWKLIRIDIVNTDAVNDVTFFNGRLFAGVR